MKGTMKMWGVAAIVALSAGTVTMDLAAQTTSMAADQARAAVLVEKAVELSGDQASFDQAAAHYRRAVEILDGGLESVEPLRMAGRLAFYAGDGEQAYEDFVQAGETALEWGDVVTAANVFLDAAWVARETDRAEKAITMLTRARKLSQSPLIAAAERNDLQRRMAEQQ